VLSATSAASDPNRGTRPLPGAACPRIQRDGEVGRIGQDRSASCTEAFRQAGACVGKNFIEFPMARTLISPRD
jgi:hypothetical protein